MRVVWFIIRKESSVKLVVLWGVMLCSTQSLVIVSEGRAREGAGGRVKLCARGGLPRIAV